MDIKISVLGDVAVLFGGHPVDLGHSRRQSVFVSLLTDFNRVVTPERLIGRVWGHRPPSGARSTLYSYISRLRAALQATGRQVTVDRKAGGYILTLNKDVAAAVDLNRFRELLARARASSDDALTQRMLEEALGLWRGDPFGALDSPWVNELRENLRQERLLAQLERNSLLLSQDRHSELLEELPSLVRQEPLNERAVGQLMLTLYREGCIAQALELYERTRQALAREMGAVPGLELRDLHLKILKTDPSLAASSRPAPVGRREAPPTATPVPNQLPPAMPLSGRIDELAALDATQTSGAPRLSVISGLGGIGKTSLALRWAHDNLSRFPDGRLYVNLHGSDPGTPATQPQKVLSDFLVGLGVERNAIPAGVEAKLGLYRSLVAQKRILILLDNARDPEQVRPLLPGTPSCTVVVTSRNRLNGLLVMEGARSIPLDLLTPAESLQLLATRIGEERLEKEPEAANAIVNGCGRFPLALAVAAVRAADKPRFPLSAFAAELREAETRLDALDTGEPSTSLRSAFDGSYQALPGPAARLMCLLSLVPGQDIGLHSIAALSRSTPSDTRVLLSKLEEFHLVHQSKPGRYGLHDLVRLCGRERVKQNQSEQMISESLHSFVNYFVHNAAIGHSLLDPHGVPSPLGSGEPPTGDVFVHRLRDQAEALEWFKTERHSLLAALKLAADMGLHREVWQLSSNSHLFFRRCGSVHDLLVAGRAGFDAVALLESSDAPALQAMARRSLASAMLLTGQINEETREHLTRALEYFKDAGDVLGEAHTYRSFALASAAMGDPEMAVSHAESSLELYLKAGNSFWETNALNTLGWCEAQMGNHERASVHCQASLSGCLSLGFQAGEAAALGSLGYIAVRTGRHAEAVTYYQQSLQIARILGDSYEEANTLTGLAEAYQALGDVSSAREHWQQAITIYRTQHRMAQVRSAEKNLRALVPPSI